MLIITEYKLNEKTVTKLQTKGYRIAYSYETPYIKKNEAVGFFLDKLYKTTVDLIENLLYHNHNVTLKYDNKVYVLNSLEDWKYTYQSETDMLQLTQYKHPIYRVYLDKRKEYLEKQKTNSLKEQFQELLVNNNITEFPEDKEIESILNTFAYLYDVNYDKKDKLETYKAYFQIKWYLDNNIEYINEIRGIDPEDEPMFSNFKFKIPPYEEPINETSFGNLEYFEDYIYKNTCTD